MVSEPIVQPASSTLPARAAKGYLHAEPDYVAAFAAAGVERIEDLLAVAGTERLDKPTLPRWRQRLRCDLPGAGLLFVKRYESPPLPQQLKRILSGAVRRSTARMEWERVRALAAAGIDAVQPVALAERMIGPWERASAVVLAGVPGESLEARVRRVPGRIDRELLLGLARYAARFHRAGFIHRDLYLSHVYVEPFGAGWRFRLIDLARLFRPRWRHGRWIVKELAALDYSTPPHAASAADRLRFLKEYLGVRRLGQSERQLVRRILAKGRRILRHDAARAASRENPT